MKKLRIPDYVMICITLLLLGIIVFLAFPFITGVHSYAWDWEDVQQPQHTLMVPGDPNAWDGPSWLAKYVSWQKVGVFRPVSYTGPWNLGFVAGSTIQICTVAIDPNQSAAGLVGHGDGHFFGTDLSGNEITLRLVAITTKSKLADGVLLL